MIDRIAEDSPELPSTDSKNKFDALLKSEMNKNQSTSSTTRTIWLWGFLIAAAVFILAFLTINQQSSSIEEEPEQYFAIEFDASNFYHQVNLPRTSNRIAAINTLEDQPHLDSDIIMALKSVLYEDESINVKLTVVESLSGYIEQEDVKQLLLQALNDQESPIIRISIINTITGHQIDNAIPEFEKLLEKNDLEDVVKDELHAGLIKLI